MKAFVSMPLNADFYPVWKAIKSACEANDILVCQANQLPGGGNVLEAINSEIDASDLVIVDFSGDKFLSFANPKVVAEARYARKREKNIAIITQSAEAVPIDWKEHRELVYKNDEPGLKYLTEVLTENLETIRNKLVSTGKVSPAKEEWKKERRRKPTSMSPTIWVLEGEEKIAVRKVGDIRSLYARPDCSEIHPPGECYPPVVSQDGSFVVFQAREEPEKIWVYDRSGRQIAAFKTAQPCGKPKMGSDGNYFVLCGMEDEGRVWLYDKSGNQIAEFATPEDCYRPIISRDGSFAVVQSREDDRVWLYGKLGEVIAEFQTPEPCYSPKISARGNYIVFQSKSDGQKIWHYDQSGKMTASFTTPEPCYRPKICPDGTYALYQSEKSSEKNWIYDCFGREVAALVTPEPCQRPVISGNGDYAIFQSERDKGKVWIYSRDGKQVASFETPQPCRRAQSTPDGSYAVFYSIDGDALWVYEFGARELWSETQFSQQIVEDGFGRTIKLCELNTLMELAAELGYEELMRSDFDIEDNSIKSIDLQGITPKTEKKYREKFAGRDIFPVI